VRATRLHGELDDSVMLVDALEPDFYAKRGFDKSVDANIIAAEIRQWLTNEGTPKELRTLTLLPPEPRARRRRDAPRPR
jgi:hypothetical protein